jgi:hypothetical protein
VDEATYRVWRLFLCGSAYGFASGALNLYQALLLKPDKGRSGLPLTRSDWYRGNDKRQKRAVPAEFDGEVVSVARSDNLRALAIP